MKILKMRRKARSYDQYTLPIIFGATMRTTGAHSLWFYADFHFHIYYRQPDSSVGRQGSSIQAELPGRGSLNNHFLTAGLPNSQTKLWRHAETRLLSRRRFRGRRKFNPSSARNSGMCKRRAARILKLRIPVLSLLLISPWGFHSIGNDGITLSLQILGWPPILSASPSDLQARGYSTANDAIALPL
ncbi:hypothetical protein EDC04DRAFT_950988 [Pisolithus marmoratus]|nr:hypothetical protein EDC04DRAFT_950988 [Pisolithus marmoratus]